jgi:hypothetical protein
VQVLVALRQGHREEADADARPLHLDGLLHVEQGKPDAARLGAQMDTERAERALRAVSQPGAGAL